MKKWTYLVVAGLLAGATPMLQSCVDNDEPEGINVLRKAKAELIAAKKVVQEAEAARLKAEAAMLEAQAAYQLAQAEIAKADAELKKTENEKKRAELEAYIAEQKLNAEHAQQEWEQQTKMWEVQYQQALVQLAQLKVALNTQQRIALQTYITSVDEAKKVYDEKMENVRLAQRTLLKATETMNDNEADKDYLTRELQRSVRYAQMDLEDAQAELEALEAELELAQTRDIEGVKERIEELQKEITAQEAIIDKTKLAVAEKKAELAPALKALEDSLTEAKNAEITINEFKYEFPYYLVSDYQGELSIVEEDITYTIADAENEEFPQAYENVVNRFERLIEAVESAKLTPNGAAWTAENIGLYKGQLADQEEKVAELKEKWQKVVDAYRTGTKYATIKAVDRYEEFVELVNTYNDNVKAYNEAKAAFDAAAEEYADIYAEFEAKEQAANKKYAEGMLANAQERNAANDTFNKTYDNLSWKAQLAKAKWEEAKAELALKSEPTQAEKDAVNDLKTAYDAAKAEAETYYDHWYNDWTNEASETVKAGETQADELFAKKNALTEATHEREIAEAQVAFTDQLKKLGYTDNLDQAYFDAYQIMAENYAKAQDLFHYLANDAFGVSDDVYCLPLTKAFYNFDQDLNQIPLTVEVNDELAYIYKYEIENELKRLSNELYGLDSERLVERTKEEIDAELAEEHEPWEYINYYDEDIYSETWWEEIFNEETGRWEMISHRTYLGSRYGAFGKMLYYQALIARAEAILAGGAELDKILEDLQAELDSIQANYDAAFAAVEAAQEAYDNKEAENEELLAEVQKASHEAEYKKSLLNSILEVYVEVDDNVEELIATLKDKIDNRETGAKAKIERNEWALADAQKNLEDWNQGAIDAVKAAQEDLEDAEAAAAIAKENLDIAQERLQKAIESMTVDAE